MKRFKFQFATVLNVRKSRENDALSHLGAAQRVYQQELAQKQELVRTLQSALVRRESLGQNGATPALSFQLEQAYITGTKQRIMRADQAIVRASRSVEKSLRAYLAARRQTRMIELLEERAFAEFKRERTKKENKELDELMVLRARLADQSPMSSKTEESA
jgi:flagellar export protein FliJ